MKDAHIGFDKLIFSSHWPVPEVMGFLADIRREFRVILGCSAEKTEPAYIVEASVYPELLEAGLLNGQESVLFLALPLTGSKSRSAVVLYLADKRVEAIGDFRAVPRSVAESHGGWCFEPVSNQWFTVMRIDYEKSA